MSILLAINTATSTTEIAILRDDKVLKEDSWEADANESDRILPYLRDTFAELKLNFQDIDELFVFKGPGRFTALRVGITIVNTLAFLLKVPIYTMKTPERDEESFGEFVKGLSLQELEKCDMVEPFYDKPPNITMPKK